MFAKALVIATATAIKLQAKVELSSLAGVNIMALSADELAQLKAGTKEDFDNYCRNVGLSTITQEDESARHELYLQNQSLAQGYKEKDPEYEVSDHNPTMAMSIQEKENLIGTHGLTAQPNQVPVEGAPVFDEETQLAQTGDLWNTVYPGCINTYQYIYDYAINENPNWGCESFDTWDEHWLEQVGYAAYRSYYVDTGYCSDEYLRAWWNANIVSWREYLRDMLQCADEPDDDDNNNGGDDDGTPNVNNCESVNAEECLWGDDYVVPVKNQRSCGSCYAFSAAQILESYSAIAGNELISLSDQQIVDCGYGNNGGCNGGWPASVLNSISDANNALWPEADYPYHATKGSCQTKSSSVRVKTVGHARRVDANSVSKLKAALLNGPLAITVDANNMFMSYGGGILRNCQYGQLNHAVNAVGWTRMNGTDVLKVRNSWGTNWGVDGHIYVAIDAAGAAENGGKGPAGILEHIYWAEATRA